MDDIDRLDRLSELSSKLYSLLAMTHGEAGTTFRNLNANLQDNFMWACCDMARELQNLVLGTSQANLMTEEAGHA